MSSFYKMDPAAWDFGTANLTLEEEAAYLRIVNAIAKHDCGVPDNDRVLAGMFRCSTRKARALRDALVDAGKITIEDGVIWNARARSELVQRQLTSVSASERGAKGGRKRAERAANHLKDNEHGQATASSRIEENRIDSPLAPQGGKPKRARKVSIPDDWTPSQADIDHAKGKGLTNAEIGVEAERFKNHAIANSRLFGAERGISAAWRNWVISPHRKPPSGNPAAPSQQSFFTEADREARDRLLGKKPELARVA